MVGMITMSLSKQRNVSASFRYRRFFRSWLVVRYMP